MAKRSIVAFTLFASLTGCGSSALNPDGGGAGGGGGGGGSGGAGGGSAGASGTGGAKAGSGGVPGTGGAVVNDGGPPVVDGSPVTDDAGVVHNVPVNYQCYGADSGQAVLDKLQKSYTVAYTPLDTKATTPLTITPHYAGGTVNCYPAVISHGGPPDLPPASEVEIQFGFVSADGLFNESFSTPVRASFIGHQLEFTAVVAADTIKGSFKPTTDHVVFYGFFDAPFGGGGPTSSGTVWARKQGATADQRVGGWQ